MRRLTILFAVFLTLSILAIPAVSAYQDCSGCRSTIQVVPVGSQKTGDPIVTGNPANLEIFHTGNGPITNVWLLIVINKPTYDALKDITIDGELFLEKEDFKLVNTQKIPPTTPKGDYPGSLCQYNVAAIKDKMGEKGKPVYYAVKFFTDEITKSPKEFTLRVNLESSADLKALVLALGRYDSKVTCKCSVKCVGPFNACSSFSKSTFVVPEASTLALTLAPLSAVAGFYFVRRKKKL
ncbi:MAG: hypothetical protein ACPLKQ_04625 [Candidatus Bathyarchaeales archaeon]